MGFVLVLRCLVIVVLFVIVLFARSVSRRANVWLVVWKGGVYNKLWLWCFVDTPRGVSFVFLVRCSPFACASGVSVLVAVLVCVSGFVSPPCCARPPLGGVDGGLRCDGFGGFM